MSMEMFNTKKKKRFDLFGQVAWLATLWLIMMLALTACGDSPTTAPSSTAVPPTATIAPPSAQDIAKQSADKLTAADSLHFNFLVKQGKAQIIQSVDVKSADGDYSKPDKYTAALKVGVLGGKLDASTVGVGSKQWVIIKGFKDSWTELPAGSGFNAAVLFDPQKGIGPTVQKAQDLKLAGSETIDGVDCWHIQGVSSGPDIAAIIPFSAGKNDVAFDLWSGKQDMLTREVLFKEKTPDPADPNGSIWELHFSNFNKAVTITPPV